MLDELLRLGGRAEDAAGMTRLSVPLASPGSWGLPGYPPQAFAERAREIVAVQDDFSAGSRRPAISLMKSPPKPRRKRA